MKGTTSLAKANRKPRAIIDDWIPLNSLFDSHDHVNPLDNKTERDKDIEGKNPDKGKARASIKALHERVVLELFAHKCQEKADSCDCHHWDT